MPNRDRFAEFTAWCGKHITGDEKGEARIFLDDLLQSYVHAADSTRRLQSIKTLRRE